MTELDEFLRIYNRELENKERQLWECLSLKYDPHSLVRDMADGEDAKAERERCENELFDWKNKDVKVRYIYTKEAERKFVAGYNAYGVEIKEVYSPRQQYGRCVIEKQSDVEYMSRNGFPLFDGENPSEIMVNEWFALMGEARRLREERNERFHKS